MKLIFSLDKFPPFPNPKFLMSDSYRSFRTFVPVVSLKTEVINKTNALSVVN